MSAWDIQPTEVNGILQTVGGHVGGEDGEGGLVAKIDTFGEHVSEAGAAAASGPIGTALEEFVGEYGPALQEMVLKSGSCIQGCVDATSAYLNGNLQMAADAQGNAGSIEDLGL
ncbi:hypothetical protein LP52_23805 [Streptomonospora alba]|uniref:PE domain-containing protein n=1 Tax=Streptomonospora alba TaxID=183763 RepID=A0A0C2FC12_9ACTN|nr:DUF6507 family protein [Streptomonospora alba]KIH96659.1 hypothetical protein LP52_23805 [Streptomonospora alba]